MEQKEVLLESLSRRVLGVKKILAEAECLFDLPKDEAMNNLLNSELEFRISLSEEIQTKIKLVDELRERSGVLWLRLGVSLRDTREGNSLYPDLSLPEIEQELEAVTTQIEAIENDPDVVYASTVIQGHQALWAKIRLQDAFTADVETYRKRQREYVPGDFVEVKRDAISTTHVVKESSWKEGKDVGGFYAGGTPFIYIRESNAVLEFYGRILQHERKHLILDGMSNFNNVDPTDIVKNVIKDFKYVLDSGEDYKSDSGEGISDYFNATLAETIINNLHNELLAEYETALSGKFGSNTYSNTVKFLGEGFIDNFLGIEVKDAADSLATAGLQFRQTLKEISQFIDYLNNGNYPEESEYLIKFLKSLKKKFIKIIYVMRSSASYAEVCGDEAEDDMRALVHILPPTKYRHIGRYLKSRYTNPRLRPGLWAEILDEFGE